MVARWIEVVSWKVNFCWVEGRWRILKKSDLLFFIEPSFNIHVDDKYLNGVHPNKTFLIS